METYEIFVFLKYNTKITEELEIQVRKNPVTPNNKK